MLFQAQLPNLQGPNFWAFHLSYLKSGEARDVFAVDSFPMVLKIQRGVFHNNSNAREAAIAEGDLRCCTAHAWDV